MCDEVRVKMAGRKEREGKRKRDLKEGRECMMSIYRTHKNRNEGSEAEVD